ncbi:MAG: two-component system activity regulator YycH [Liquorilactobacillus hordei]|uniref:YycH family regulatory protein n=1 Tax=Liquorilactobacillus hordei TaxID=468911 RepID=UPI0039E90C07
MKLRKILLHTGLTVTILISVFFSALIWFNPAMLQHDSKETTDTGENTTSVSKKTLSDIFLPLQATYNVNDLQYQLPSSENYLIGKVWKIMKKWNSVSTSTKIYKNSTDYLNFLKQNNALLLNYNSPITVKVFNKVFTQKIEGLSKFKFNRIMIPLENENYIYLMNDQSKAVCKVVVNNMKAVKKIKTYLKSSSIQNNKLEIDYYVLNNRIINFYVNSVQLPKYSYLYNKTNISSYVSELLNPSGQTSITTKLQKNKTVYLDGSDNRLTLNDTTSAVQYENYSALDYYDDANSGKIKTQKLNYYTHLTESLNQLNKIGVAPDNLRFDEVNSEDGTVTYRSYIAGFPIISNDNYGTYKIKLMSTGGKEYNFSLNSLQVPVPASQYKQNLPSTYTVLRELENAGYTLSKIKDIRVGYKWQKNQSSNLVVDMIPTYYVYIDGRWSELEDLLSTN